MKSNDDELLRIEDLSVKYRTPAGTVNALNDVDLKIKKGEIVGIVGESGSGKSTLAYAIIGLLPLGTKITGTVLFDGENMVGKGEKEMQKIRGSEISMVFQDPMTSLNPLYRVREQFLRVLKTHTGIDKNKGIESAKALLKEVEMAGPESVLNSFPFELSGGMQQRVMIAMALSSEPKLMIADEPTTAVDATIQSQILELLKKINEEKNLTIMLITHNLGIVAQSCDSVVIMYAGKIVEKGIVDEIFTTPLHPYTSALLSSVPKIGKVDKSKDLPTIKGNVPNLLNLPKGCPFSPRCEKAIEMCSEIEPEITEVEKDHLVACHLVNDVVKNEQ